MHVFLINADQISEAEMWTASGVVRKSKEQHSSMPASARPQTVSPPPIVRSRWFCLAGE